jgi:hypothetical protein
MYYADTSKFALFNQIAASATPSTKFQVALPSGFNSPSVEVIPDVTGDGKEDIMLEGSSNDWRYYYLLIDGASGATVLQTSSANSGQGVDVDYIGDVDGDGRNEVVCNQWTDTPDTSWWTIYPTNGISTGVNQKGYSGPTTFQLRQNYPNPFNPSTTIMYSLPASESVTLKVYDILGREVKTLVDERQSAGNHSVNLNASGLASGVYFYQLQAGRNVQAKKLVVIK